jgi:hypothetical protein
MASILRVNTLTDASSGNSTAMSTINQGTAKAWIHVAADGASISDSFNISSHDDDGSGDGGININNDMSNNDYAITSMASDAGASTVITTLELTQNTEATGSFDYETAYANSSTNRTNHDANRMMTIHGDLA